jgi:hypothetical protein
MPGEPRAIAQSRFIGEVTRKINGSEIDHHRTCGNCEKANSVFCVGFSSSVWDSIKEILPKEAQPHANFARKSLERR